MKNLIINGGFENDLGSWIDTLWWPEELCVTDDCAHSGAYSLKFSSGLLAGGRRKGGGGSCRIYHDLDLEPHTEYVFSFWVNTVNGYRVDLVDYNTGKLLMACQSDDLDTHGEWQLITAEFYSGDMITLSVEISVASALTAPLYYDDFELYSKKEPVRTGDYENISSFRQGYIISKLESKREDCRESASLFADSSCDDALYWQSDADGYEGFAQIVENAGVTGGALQVSGEGCYTKWLDVDPYTRYCFTFYGRVDTNHFSDLEIQLVDAQGKPLSMSVWRPSVSQQTRIPGQDGFWHKRTLYVCIREATRIGMRLESTIGTAYLDNIAFYKQEDLVIQRNPVASVAAEETVSTGEISGCAFGKNQLPSPDMAGDFWKAPRGFGEFMDLIRLDDVPCLRYMGKRRAYYYMVPMTVQPHTNYVFSYYAYVMQAGEGAYGLLDGDGNRTTLGELHDLTSEAAQTGWRHHTVTFTSGDCDRVYFAVYDDGGAAIFAKLRLFCEEDSQPLLWESDCPTQPELEVDNCSPERSFINGILIPWFYSPGFGRDIGTNYDSNYTDCKFDEGIVRAGLWNAKAMGFDMVKLWLSEKMEGVVVDANGHIVGVDKLFIQNLECIFDIAEEYGLILGLTLVPHFDLSTSDSLIYARMMRFVQNPAITQEYLENWVTPVLNLASKYSNIQLVEIYGEAEGDTEDSNWRMDRGTTWQGMIRFARNVAAFVRKNFPQYPLAISSGNYYDSLTQFYNPMELDYVGTDIYNPFGELKSPKELKLNAPMMLGEYGTTTRCDQTTEKELYDLAALFMNNAITMGYSAVFLWHPWDHLSEGLQLNDGNGDVRPHAAFYRFFALDQRYKRLGKQLDQPMMLCNAKLDNQRISWFGSRGAQMYELERSEDGKEWMLVATIPQTVCEENMLLFRHVDTSAVTGKDYVYRVTALINGQRVASEASPWFTAVLAKGE